jgi:hypothetical protein
VTQDLPLPSRPGLHRPITPALLLELASRTGYAARGVVYISVGVVALLAAAHVLPHARGVVGLLEAWAHWPVGLVLIWLVGAGLAAFAGWRVLQAFFDVDDHGRSPWALAVRSGQALSGVMHGALALSAFKVLDGLEDFREIDEDRSAREAAATALAMPHGDWLLIGAGLAIIVVSIGNTMQGAFQDFGKRLGCSDAACLRFAPLARLGYVGRSAALAMAGVMLLRAGVSAQAMDARSLGGALEMLKLQPFGPWLLGMTAVGLIAFGLFALVEARFRKIRI